MRAGTSTKLTFEPHREFDPAWSADGSYVAFTMTKNDGTFGLYRRRANGSGETELLDGSAQVFKSPAWSLDDRLLVYTKGTQHNGDLWTVPLRGERKRSSFLNTPYDESNPSFSPDGRWIAYQSNKSGRTEVYVRAFTEDGGEIKISQHGGRAPRWRADGRELFFLAPDSRLMAAGFDPNKDDPAMVPEELFQTGLRDPGTQRAYDVARDGRRFLIPTVRNAPGSRAITVVLNWPATRAK